MQFFFNYQNMQFYNLFYDFCFFCLLRTIFGVIQDALMLPIHVRVNETTFLLGGAAYLSSAIAQIVQAPIFLFISSMRQALLKTLVRHRR